MGVKGYFLLQETVCTHFYIKYHHKKPTDGACQVNRALTYYQRYVVFEQKNHEDFRFHLNDVSPYLLPVSPGVLPCRYVRPQRVGFSAILAINRVLSLANLVFGL